MIDMDLQFSRYLAMNSSNLPIRRWAARALLIAKIDLSTEWASRYRDTASLFDRFGIDAGTLDTTASITRWLKMQLDACGKAPLDTRDPFVVNTTAVGRDLRLDKVELSVLRFALMLNQSVPLRRATDALKGDMTMLEACDAIADVLELDRVHVRMALQSSSRLRRTGLMPRSRMFNNTGDLEDWATVSPLLLNHVFYHYPDGFSIEQELFGTPAEPQLARRDLLHLGDRLDTLRAYLSSACRENVSGSNILLYGAPGTGKTELARWLARSVRRPVLEIAVADSRGQSRDNAERLDAWCLCQGIVPTGSRRIVIFDEVEEILSNASLSRHGFYRSDRIGKGFLNAQLESNHLPTVWITNTLAGVDEAYLRRFDLTMHVPAPDETVRRRMVRHAFRGLDIERSLVEAIAEQNNITPALVAKAARVCRMTGAQERSRVEAVARQVIDESLRAMGHRVKLPIETGARRRAPQLPTSLDVLNTDVDVVPLLQSLSRSGYGRLCLYGLPGTGKSAFAAEVARRLKRPLLVRQVSDIRAPLVGETERNIADAFNQAARDGAVLLLDEADSFLQDRRGASRHWEVTQVNQFLTSLERYEGILVCTTNLVDSLDPATLRRFDFKVLFRCMSVSQSKRMVHRALKALGATRAKVTTAQLDRLNGHELVPGDFAVALRQGAMAAGHPSARSVVDAVLAEARMRAPNKSRAIGFVSDLGGPGR